MVSIFAHNAQANTLNENSKKKKTVEIVCGKKTKNK